MSATAKKSDGIWDMVKLGLILAVYAVAACTVLAVVHNVTAPVIESNNLKKAAAAMKMVFPEADQFETADGFNGSTKSGNTVIGSINLAKKGGEILGAVAEISGPTYDRSTIMVGMDVNGIVTGMRYLDNTDTPSFGQKGSDPTYKLSSGETFFGQFTGKDSSEGFIAGATFDAISGATITSNGIGVLMDDACAAMTECLSQARSGK